MPVTRRLAAGLGSALASVTNAPSHAIRRTPLGERDRGIAARRLEALQALATELAGALTTAQITDLLMSRGIAALRADGSAVFLIDPGEAALTAIGWRGHSEARARTMGHLPLDVPLPATDVARTGEPVFIEDPHAFVAPLRPHVPEDGRRPAAPRGRRGAAGGRRPPVRRARVQLEPSPPDRAGPPGVHRRDRPPRCQRDGARPAVRRRARGPAPCRGRPATARPAVRGGARPRDVARLRGDPRSAGGHRAPHARRRVHRRRARGRRREAPRGHRRPGPGRHDRPHRERRVRPRGRDAGRPGRARGDVRHLRRGPGHRRRGPVRDAMGAWRADPRARPDDRRHRLPAPRGPALRRRRCRRRRGARGPCRPGARQRPPPRGGGQAGRSRAAARRRARGRDRRARRGDPRHRPGRVDPHRQRRGASAAGRAGLDDRGDPRPPDRLGRPAPERRSTAAPRSTGSSAARPRGSR